MYFVKPDGRLEWAEFVDEKLVQVIAEQGRDIGAVADFWREAGRGATVRDVRVAIRYGIAVAGGILVGGHLISEVARPEQLRTLIAQAQQSRDAARAQTDAVDAFMEAQAPGWTKASEEIDQRADASMAEAVAEADAEAAKILSAEPKAELVEHWESVGGLLPSPL